MRALSTITRHGARERCSSATRGRGVAARRVGVDLSTRDIERIAAHVAQLLRESEEQSKPELLSAGELAHELRVERPWVYRHRELLGGWRLGDGPKAPWRFDRQTAIEARRRQAEQQTDGGE